MLCSIILVAYTGLLYWWGVVCLVLSLTATIAQAQEEGGVLELPLQVLKGMDMLYQVYELEAFDCGNPEEVVTQSNPHSCSVKSLD